MIKVIRCEPQDHLVWKDGQQQLETDRTPLIVQGDKIADLLAENMRRHLSDIAEGSSGYCGGK